MIARPGLLYGTGDADSIPSKNLRQIDFSKQGALLKMVKADIDVDDRCAKPYF